MKSKIMVVVAILAVMCWAGAALAYELNASNPTLSFSTADGNLSNVFSHPADFTSGTATAVLTLVNPGAANAFLDIVLTNTTAGGTPSNSGVLGALFWTSNTFFPGSGTADGQIVNPAGGTDVSNFWGYASTTGLPFGFGTDVAGNQGVSAVGLGFGAATGTTGFTPVATPGSNTNNIDGIDYTIVATGTIFGPGNFPTASGPNVEPFVHITLNLPNATSYSFSDPEAWWGTATGNTVPLPPSVLLMGSGLLGLGLVGWRRRSQQA